MLVINYKGERIPVIPKPGHNSKTILLISSVGRNWRIDENGDIEMNGCHLTPEEVTMGYPGVQDDPVMQALYDFDSDGDFPPLSYPIPSAGGDEE